MTLAEWLAFIERQHAKPIELGLDRVRRVSESLGQQKTCPVVIVGGTNGKGSTCAMLERILLCAGYRVGLYSSPHLLRYNERVRVAGRPVDDEALCAGFARVEAAREVSHGGTPPVPLTYFEYGTLCAWEVFSAQPLDAIVLEVGLGGRLDATNLYDADVAIVTGIDLDHMDYLGPTREDIGYEKAGIFRAGRAAICGDADPPRSLTGYARAIGADLQVLGRDFGYERQDGQWQFTGRHGKRSGLAFPGLRGVGQLGNASCVLAALDELRDRLPVAMQDIRRGLLETELPGRFQVLPGRPTVVLDVAHNPQAAHALADNLGSMAYHPATWAVFGMLRDKDIRGVIAAMRGRVDHWLPATLPGQRAATAAELAAALLAAGVVGPLPSFESPAAAFAHARGHAGEDDRIIAFGSFLTVAGVLHALGRAAS
jgi:dihydrofolate synthase/folylpolyglutamate synthase